MSESTSQKELSESERFIESGSQMGRRFSIGLGLSKDEVDTLRAIARFHQKSEEPNSAPFANPVPLGLGSFAMTTFVLGLTTVGVRGVSLPNVVNSLAFFYGGAAQFMAGMWGFAVGDQFAATVFTSYGAFWISYASISTPAFSIAAAYADEPEMLHNALGLFNFVWFIFTFILLISSFKTTVSLVSLLTCLDLAFLLLGCAEMTGNHTVQLAGGWFTIITAVIAWYNAFGAFRDPKKTFVPHYDVAIGHHH